MERGRRIIINTLLLTASAFFMRAVGMGFQVWLSGRIGASGIGLIQLIMSVSVLAATFAVSGIRFTALRLVSEELSRGSAGSVKCAVGKCLGYSVSFGTAASVLLYLLSGFIGRKLIGSPDTVLSLRILALSLPALSMSTALNGYFTAVSRVAKSAAAQCAEQLVRISFVVFALTVTRTSSVRISCAIVVSGGVLGDFVSLAIQYGLYKFDVRRYGRGKTEKGMMRRLLNISSPLALSSYARSALSTIQNLLIPNGLRRYGMDSETALSRYGTVTGMALPVITFPLAFFYAIADLLVPELTAAQEGGRTQEISRLVSRTLRLCILLSIPVSAVMFGFSEELGEVLYSSAEAGKYIRIMALCAPVMYLDGVTDGMLRGLGEHIYTMRVNIADSVISVLMVWILIPRFAVNGYIFIVIFTEVFNFIFSIGRLAKITKISVSPGKLGKAAVSAIGSVNISAAVLRALGMPLNASPFSVVSHVILSAAVYSGLLVIFGCLKKRDAAWLRALIR